MLPNIHHQATRGVLLSALLLSFCGGALARWTAPSLRAALDAHWTDNELADSTRQEDKGAVLNLRLRQPLGPFSVEAGGSLDRHDQHSELDQSSHSALASLNLAPGHWESLWAHAGLFNQAYSGDYQLYDRRRLFAAAGLRRVLVPHLKGRAQAQAATTRFPSYPDSLQANYRDLVLTVGLNGALPWPLAVDVEGGLQERRYVDMSEPVATAWSWSTLRLSRPLGERLGLRLQGSRRWQMSQSAVELDSLAANGLDPGELLYDGWQAELGLQHLGRRWRSTLSAERLWASYAAEPGVSARKDQSLALSLGATRALPLRQGWTLGLNLQLSRRWTRSSVAFYNTPSTLAQVGLSLALP